jgi:hypothetical protein
MLPMNTLTKPALGLMGQLKPRPAVGSAATTLELPTPNRGLESDHQLLLAHTVGLARGDG